MKTRLVAIIQASNRGLTRNFSAYCPDIPGCIAHGPTEEKALAALQLILAHQIENLEELGLELPKQQCKLKILEVETQAVDDSASTFSNLARLH